MRKTLAAWGLSLVACGVGGPATGPSAGPAASPVAQSPTVAGCPVLPPDNPWNADISREPVDPRSEAYIASIGATKTLHADFGGDRAYGIPWIAVPGTQPKVPWSSTTPTRAIRARTPSRPTPRWRRAGTAT